MGGYTEPFLLEGRQARVARDLEVTVPEPPAYRDRLTRLRAGETVTIRQLVPLANGRRLARVETAGGVRLTVPAKYLEAC